MNDTIIEVQQQTMTHSPELTNLAAALVKVQGAVENPHKTSVNPHYKSTYADLTEIINTIRPVLSENGIAVVQSPGMQNGNAFVETILIHKSGEWIRGRASSPLPKNDPQGVGSAITYLRRYSLAGLLGLGQEDDDGNDASWTPTGNAPPTEAPPSAPASGDILDQPCPIRKHEGKPWRQVCEEDPDYIIGYVIPKHDRTPKAVKDALAAYLEGNGGPPNDDPKELQDIRADIGHRWRIACDKASVPNDARSDLMVDFMALYDVDNPKNPTAAECQKILEGMKDKSPDKEHDNFIEYWVAENGLPF